jgi:threonine-phosphate decarboxylase
VYPDPECVEVRQALAACYRLEPDQVLVGNGASELIDLLPRSLSMRCALVLGPTFTEYARAVTLAGGRVLTVNAERGDGYRPPIGRVLKQLRQQHHSIDAVFVCNPNNPTGQLVDRETLAHLVDLASQWGLWILVDESFIDFCGDQSVLPFVSRYPRLLVLRSLTKFYALPGLRIGYLVGAKAVVEAIRAQQPPWSVNALAQVAAVASLKDHRYARRAIRFVARERERLQRGLESIPGMRVYPSAANFLLVELPRACLARTVAQLLCQKGILIRDCSGIPGLSPQTIRVAVRSEAQNCRLIKALKQVLRCSHSPTRSSEGLCRL